MWCHHTGDEDNSRNTDQERDRGGKTGYSRSKTSGLQNLGQPVVESVIDGLSKESHQEDESKASYPYEIGKDLDNAGAFCSGSG